MGKNLDDFLVMTLYKNDGRLDNSFDFIAFHDLEEIIAGFSYVLSQNFEYKPIFKVIYESLQIPIKYSEDQEYLFRARKGYIIYSKEGDPEDNLVISVEEIQDLPIFIENLDKKNWRLLFYLDGEIIDYILKSKKHSIFGFMTFPISKINLEYFSKSNIVKLDIGDVKLIHSYPIVLKIENFDEFLKLMKIFIIQKLETPNYII